MEPNLEVPTDWIISLFNDDSDPSLRTMLDESVRLYRYSPDSGILVLAMRDDDASCLKLYRVETMINRVVLLYAHDEPEVWNDWIHLELSTDGQCISAGWRAPNRNDGGGTHFMVWSGETLAYEEDDPEVKMRYTNQNNSHQFFAVMHPDGEHLFCWMYGGQTLKVIHMPTGEDVASLQMTSMYAMGISEAGDRLLISNWSGHMSVYLLPDLELDFSLGHSIGYDWWGPMGLGINAAGDVAMCFEGKDRDSYWDINHQVNDHDSHLVMWQKAADGKWTTQDAFHFRKGTYAIDADSPFAIRAVGNRIYWAGVVDDKHILWMEFPTLRQVLIEANLGWGDKIFFNADASVVFSGSDLYSLRGYAVLVAPADAAVPIKTLQFPRDDDDGPDPVEDWRVHWDAATGCLDLTGTGMQSLDFLAEVPDLVSLILDDSDVLALPALVQHAHLRKVSLNQCLIQDFQPLRGMAALQELSLQDCVFPDLDWLQGLVGLRKLDLKGCPVTDLRALAGLPNLEWLSLEGTLVNDLGPLRGLPLRHLDLTQSKVPDLEPLFETGTLEVLIANYIRLAEFQGSNNWQNLRRLELRTARIEPHTLLQFPQLEWLDISVTDIQDFSFLRKLTGLKGLDLNFTAFEDLADIAHLRELEYLNIRDTAVRAGLDLLVGMPLQDLRLFGKHFADLAPIGELPTLRRLDIVINRLHDFGPMVARLTGLERLLIGGAGGEGCSGSIAFLAPLQRLRWLELNMGVVDDMAPLAQLTALQHLQIWVSSITHHCSLAALTSLRSLKWSYRSQSPGSVPDIFSELRDLRHFDASLFPFSSTAFLAQLRELRHLKLHGYGGKSKEVLENMPHLESLDFDGQSISGLGHVSKLRHLTLHGDADPAPAFQLRRLRSLSLSFANFPLKRLEKLVALRSLSIAGAALKDLTGLPSLPALRSLSIGGFAGKNLAGLERLSGLNSLTLSNCTLHNFPNLQDLLCLHKLECTEVTLQDTTGLGTLTSLLELTLQYPHFGSFDWLAQLQNLRNFRLNIVSHRGEPGEATDLNGLWALRRLQSISLDTHLVKSIPDWGFMQNVEYAWLDIPALESVPPTTIPLPKLRSLYFECGHAIDFSFLGECMGLNDLQLPCKHFHDLTVIQGLTSLRKLNIYRTSVASLTPIKALRGLRDLEFSNTKVTTLDGLSDLLALEDLRFEGVSVPTYAPLKGLHYLEWIAGDLPADQDISLLADKTHLKTIMLGRGKIKTLQPLFPILLSGQIEHLSMLDTTVTSLPKGLKFDRYDFIKNLKAYWATRSTKR